LFGSSKLTLLLIGIAAGVSLALVLNRKPSFAVARQQKQEELEFWRKMETRTRARVGQVRARLEGLQRVFTVPINPQAGTAAPPTFTVSPSDDQQRPAATHSIVTGTGRLPQSIRRSGLDAAQLADLERRIIETLQEIDQKLEALEDTRTFSIAGLETKSQLVAFDVLAAAEEEFLGGLTEEQRNKLVQEGFSFFKLIDVGPKVSTTHARLIAARKNQ
jgi:hypothetical protein